MTRKKRTLFTDEFFNVFDAINLQSLFIYQNSIGLSINFNPDKLNVFLSNINSYGSALSESVLSEALILNIPIKENILGIPVFKKYSSTGIFYGDFLKHLYDASTDTDAFVHNGEEDIYLDISFIDLYSMSVAYFIVELYKSSPTVTKFKSVCKSISNAVKNGTFTLNFTSDVDNFELVSCKYPNVFDYYGKQPSDFEDGSFIASVSSESFTLKNTNYKIYCSLSQVPYQEHYQSLLLEEGFVQDFVFATSSPFMIPYSIPEYFRRLSKNSMFSSLDEDSACESMAQCVTSSINSLFSFELANDVEASTKVSPITFSPITNASNVHSKPFSLNFFGSNIDFFMNFNTGTKSICSKHSNNIHFSNLNLSKSFGDFSSSIIDKAKSLNLYKEPANNLESLFLNKNYLIDPSYNYAVYFLGKKAVRALPFSPYTFFKESPYKANATNSYNPISTFTSTEENPTIKNYFVRSFSLSVLSSFYSHALNVKDTMASGNESNLNPNLDYFDSKLHAIVDYAFNHSESTEVSLLTYFYYLLKDSSNQESIHLIMDLFN